MTGQPSNLKKRPLRLAPLARHHRRARIATWLSAATLVLALALPVTASAQSLSVGFASGGAGGSVVVPLTFSGDGVAHLQVDVGFDDTVLSPDSVAAAGAFVDHQLDWSVVAPGVLRVVVWSPSCAASAGSAALRRAAAGAELGDGVLVHVSWEIAAAATPGTYPLNPSAALLSTVEGAPVSVALEPGAIEVEEGAAILEIPTLDEWGLIGLTILLLGAAFWVLRRGASAGVAATLVFLLLTQPLLGQVSLRSGDETIATRSSADPVPRPAAALGDPGDADGDGSLTPADLAAVVDVILERGAGAGDPDCNEDGLVDVLDLACVVAAYCADGPPDNLPPSLAPIGGASLRVGEVFAFQASASDPDPGDVLTFSLLSAPVGMVVDREAGSVLWVPREPQVGMVTPRLRVTDQGGLFAERDFVVSVRAFGAPPVLQPIADQATVEGSGIAVTAVATDLDLPDDALTFSLPLSPAGMTIGATSGQIAWTPGSSQVGVHDVTVQVEDQEGLLDFTHFVASVRAVNRPPVARDEVYEARLGVPLAVGAPGVLGNDEDPDGDPLTAALVDDAAQGVLSLAADGGLDYLLVPPDRTTPVELELLCDNSGGSHGSASAVNSRYQTNATPVVGDVDGDGDIEIVGAAVLSGATFLAELWIMNAADCSEQLETGATVEAAGGFSPNTQFGLHDIDGDGDLEIIGTRARFPFAEGGLPDDEHLIALHHDGTLAWPGNGGSETSTILGPDTSEGNNNHVYRHAGPTFADLDGDGTVEIVMPFSIGSGFSIFSGVVVYDATDGSIVWEFVSDFRQGGGNDQKVAYVVDLDLDGTMEVIIHNSVLDHLGQLEFELPSEPSAGTFTAGHLTLGIGNFDDDPFPELIGRDQRYLYLFEHDGTLTWKQEKRNNSEGQIAVADFDGDGEAEWAHVTCGTFGFVDCAPYFLAVYKADGSLLWSHESEPDFHLDRAHNRSVNPTAFDANRDGAFDLVFRNDTFGVETLFIFDGRDGSVLTSVPAGKYTGEQRFIVVADVDGDGHAELITSYTGGGTSGQTEIWKGTAANPLPAAPGYRHQWIFHEAYVNDDLTIPQNPVPHWLQPGRNGYHMITQEPDPLIGTTDSFTYVANDGALDSNLATVTLDILPPGNPPRFLSEPDTLTTRGFQYVYRPWVVDPDLGDTVTFRLTAGPAGMTIDPATGEVRWQPDTLGVFDVAILALDTIGFATAQAYELTVGDPVVVPDVVGDPEAAAESALVAADLLVGRKTVANHPTIPLGSVAAQAPVGGSVAEFGGTVHLVLSLGPSPGDVDGDGDGFTPNQGDCDDTDPSIHPGAVDPSGDGVDQDCDGFDGSEPVQEIVIEPASLDLLAGEKRQLTAYALFADGTSQIATGIVTWSSLPATTATVSPTGLLTAVADTGPAVITATRLAVVGTADVNVTDRDSADDDAPEVAITSPGDGDSVFAPVDVLGTAADSNLVRYELAISPAGEETFTVIGGGTSPVVAGALGELDPTLMLNGLYTLRLTVLDAGGNQTTDEVTVTIDGQQKAGIFTLGFTDLQVPVSGVPITVSRTYDSRDQRRGDFGIGWRLGLQAIEMTCTNPLGEGWFVAKSGLSFVLLPTRTHRCSVSIPGERAEQFNFVTSATASPIIPFLFLGGRFEPLPGTEGMLESLDPTFLAIVDPQPGEVTLRNDADISLFAPLRFRYTRKDGTRVDFGPMGVERIEDRNGNTLVVDPAGIVHSSGKSVTFERDTQGRIVELIDPAGNAQTYAYSAAGDLVAHADAVGNTTRFFYDRDHGLLRVEDPLDRPLARTEYDDAGRVVAITDANGNRVEIDHQLAARVEVRTDPDGSNSVIEYDERGNVLREVDGAGGETVRTFDEAGNVLTATNPRGGTITYNYDSQSRPLSQTNPNGHQTSYAWDASGNLAAVTDGTGAVVAYDYDSRGNLIATTDPSGAVTTRAYDAAGNLVSIRDPLGNVTRYEVDAFGNRMAEIDPTGARVERTHSPNGRILTESREITTPEGTQTLVTEYTYDAAGRPSSVSLPDGGTWATEYDAAGNPSASVDPLGRRTEASTDWAGRPTELTYPDGERNEVQYGFGERVLSLVSRSGSETRWNYDGVGRPTELILPDTTLAPGDNPRVEVEYALDGLPLAITFPGGGTTEFVHDDSGQLVSSVDPAAGETIRTYDAAGRLIVLEDAAGHVTSWEYDLAGNVIRTAYPGGTEVLMAYDATGNLISQTDEAGETTEFEYDAAGRLTAVVDPLGARTEYSYDEAGNLLIQLDALGRATRYEYDQLGRRTSILRPGGQKATFAYDAAGNLVERTDFNGSTTHYEYSLLDQLVAVSYPDGSSVELEYTTSGSRREVQDARGTTRYEYDELGRLVRRTEPDSETLEYTYDNAGRVATLATASGVTAYAYDGAGRIASVTDPDGGLTTFTYDLLGNLSRVDRPNGWWETRSYDARSRPVQLEIRDDLGGLVDGWEYEYAADGIRTAVEGTRGRREWSYDAADRLVAETITGLGPTSRTISYVYDAVNNRLERDDSATGVVTYSYDVDDRLTEVASGGSSTTFDWDPNGNVLAATGPDGNATFDWDFENRLVEAALDLASVRFTYDLDGLRTSSEAGGVEERFLWDTSRPLPQMVEEYVPGGARVPYVYGETLLSQGIGTDTRFVLQDAHSGVRRLVDSSGSTTGEYSYDAFGRLLAPASTSGTRFLYRGEQSDSDLGWTYLRARYYDQEVGRFVSVDPFDGILQDPRTRHRYLYANASPLSHHDATGLMTYVDVQISLGIMATMSAFSALSIAAITSTVRDQVEWSGKLTIGTLAANPAAAVASGWKMFAPGPEFGLSFYSARSNCHRMRGQGSELRKTKEAWWLSAYFGIGAGLLVGGTQGAFDMRAANIVEDWVSLSGPSLFGNLSVSLVSPGVGYAVTGWLSGLGRGAGDGTVWGLDASLFDILGGFTIPLGASDSVVCDGQ